MTFRASSTDVLTEKRRTLSSGSISAETGVAIGMRRAAEYVSYGVVSTVQPFAFAASMTTSDTDAPLQTTRQLAPASTA